MVEILAIIKYWSELWVWCRCRVIFDPPLSDPGYQLINPPDHNIPFEMIPLKLKVDTKHNLIVNAKYMQCWWILFRTRPWTSAIYLHRPLLVLGPHAYL